MGDNFDAGHYVHAYGYPPDDEPKPPRLPWWRRALAWLQRHGLDLGAP